MDFMTYLLPALVGAVAIFFTSFFFWMVLKPWHGPDIQPLPDEEGLTSSLGTLNIPPGFYMWPHCSPGDPEQAASMKGRFASGPWGSINILAKAPNFARNLAGVFLVYFVTMLATAIVVGMGTKTDAGFGDLFWPCALVSGVVFCLGPLPVGFFHGKPTRYLLTDFIDGLLFAVIGSVILAAMWPAAS